MGKSKLIIIILLFPLFFLVTVHAENEIHSHFHIVDIANPISFEDIKARYKSYDTIDGDISEHLIFISDYEKDYNSHTLELKDYPLRVSIKNSRGFETTRMDIISLREFEPPQVEQIYDEITINISKENIEESLLNCFNISDNSNMELVYEWLGIEDIHNSGTYKIKLIVYDVFSNASIPKEILVHITETYHTHILDQPILINEKSLSEVDLLNEFLKLVTIENGYQSYTVQSNYFTDKYKPGIYQVTLQFYYPDDIVEIYQCKIINELAPTVKGKTNPIIYITLSIILILSLIGIIIYIKRR